MEYILLLQRGWQILRRHKVMWLFGFIAVVAGQDALFQLRGALRLQPLIEAIVNLPAAIADLLRGLTVNDTGVLSLLLFLGAGVLLTFGGVFASAAIIALTHAAERGAAVNFKVGWQAGWQYSWTLLVIRLIFNIPGTLISLAAFIWATRALDPTLRPGGYSQLPQTLQAIGVLPLFLLGGALIGMLLGAIGVGADRSCVLDQTGVLESLKQGWRVLRANLRQYVSVTISLVATLGMLFFAISCPIAILLTDAIVAVAQASPNTDILLALARTPLGFLGLIALLIGYGGYTAFATIMWTLAYSRYA